MQGTFELANKEENREKNRYPNILPSKILFFFFYMIGGVLTTLNFALQLLVILPVQSADSRVLRGQGLGQDSCSAFARGHLGVSPTWGSESLCHSWSGCQACVHC